MSDVRHSTEGSFSRVHGEAPDMAVTKRQSPKLARISVRGVVQGVGFRPFVYRTATRHNLRGWVCNTSEDVRIEIEGEGGDIERFELELRTQAPPLAHIDGVTIDYGTPVGYDSFEIRHSQTREGKHQLISPDIATCDACRHELLNTEDRRYRYPFTNCTDCGPRFTIIEDMPYDRPTTTMSRFTMCPACQAEYDNPMDRRFHAQPNACPECGPSVELVDNRGKPVAVPDTEAASREGRMLSPDPIAAAGQLLREGSIIAVRGLGGFLLACDAGNDVAVRNLRQRKNRRFKPFAVMVADMAEAKKHCYVSPEEEGLLASPQSPIVLLRWKSSSTLSQEIAPNLAHLGVMLPYAPLHHILLRDTGLPLVMTSGNLSEEPIARDNDEALRRLESIADYFLIHNRDIYSRYDDSVAMVERGNSLPVRRARGYAPHPVTLPFKSREVLGCGAEVHSTFCLTRDHHAFLSQHIGDMKNMETMEHFASTLSLYKKLFGIEPEVVAHDLHPDYLTTRYAGDLAASGLRPVPVQHHHAHIVSCMTDNGLESPVIGVAFDGTGMGADGHIWGGEFLVAGCKSFTRSGHLEYIPLPGGDAAIRRPYRTAVSYTISLLGEDALRGLPFMERVSDVEAEVIKRQIEKGLNSPLTSSMGRLFDAVSALIGIRDEIDYEGQAAIELEMAAYKEDTAVTDSYPYSIVRNGELRIIKPKELIEAVVEDLRRGSSSAGISVRFHNTVAQMASEMCQMIAEDTGLNRVALSGGVFQNRLLLRKAIALLEESGFEVFTHRQVPCNDGGVSLGQAVIANLST